MLMSALNNLGFIQSIDNYLLKKKIDFRGMLLIYYINMSIRLLDNVVIGGGK